MPLRSQGQFLRPAIGVEIDGLRSNNILLNILILLPYRVTAALSPACKQQSGERDEPSPAPAPGVLILSEAVSCSPVLRGSFSVNPWQVQAVADAMAVAVTADEVDRTAWHEVGDCVG